jgi:hypothetical protein
MFERRTERKSESGVRSWRPNSSKFSTIALAHCALILRVVTWSEQNNETK